MLFSRTIKPRPLDMLWHIALGEMPGFMDDPAVSNDVGWMKLGHRGVQYLDKFQIPRKQKSYIFNEKWEIKFDASFEQVIRACADTTRHTIQIRSGKTWISNELIEGMLKLHAMGYAHSYEAWCDGRLAGGVWGFQIGGFVSMNSMFHTVSNASKAAFARAQIMLKDRGFTMIDMNGVPDHLVNFGIEWMPQWKYEQEVARLSQADLTVADGAKHAPLPWQIKHGLPLVKKVRGMLEKVRPRGKSAAAGEAPVGVVSADTAPAGESNP